MPYQTRRISVNLEALGVQLPHSRNSNKSPPKSPHEPPVADGAPPAKRLKRSHTLDSVATPTPTTATATTTTLPSRPRVRKTSSTSERRAAIPAQPTPPPSPKHLQHSTRIDKQGIHDDIVVAVLEQLEATGNRPHLIKELVAVLTNILPVVETSQNPVAIISSRLTNYLKRPWTALAPCPLTKEQVTVHPRRVYYYLTTMARQEIPEYSNAPPPHVARHIISPSISSGPDDDLEQYQTARENLSPSPELDLPIDDSILAANGVSEIQFPDSDFNLSLHDDIDEFPLPAEPAQEALEYEEREFCKLAGIMLQRKQSEQAVARSLSPDGMHASNEHNNSEIPTTPSICEELGEMSEGVSEEVEHLRNQEAAAALFGHAHHHLHLTASDDFVSSPMLRPQSQQANNLLHAPNTTPQKHLYLQSPRLGDVTFTATKGMYDHTFGAWGDLKSPENIELAELDDLLGDY